MPRHSLLRIGVLVACAVMLMGKAVRMAETMVLQTEGGESGPVTLDHHSHAMERGIACTDCHHNMAEVGTPKCNSCHTLKKTGEARALEEAYHDSCLGCHQDPPKGATPPVECEQCHKK